VNTHLTNKKLRLVLFHSNTDLEKWRQGDNPKRHNFSWIDESNHRFLGKTTGITYITQAVKTYVTDIHATTKTMIMKAAMMSKGHLFLPGSFCLKNIVTS
jgi:hypothetical protein